MALGKKLEHFVKSHHKLGWNKLKKLKNQTRGGESNEKGGRHERYFAVFQLAKHFPVALRADVTINHQAEAYVDDLVVINKSEGTKFSYQLKDSATVSWRGKRGIVGYFTQQHILDAEYHGIPAAITVLVLGNKKAFDKLSSNIPKEIDAHTEVLYFENCESPNKLLLCHSEFRSSIEQLCVSSDLNQLEMIVQGLLGAWEAHKSTVQDLELIVQKAIAQMKPNVFKNFDGHEVELNPDFKAIVDSIDGLSYEVTNGGFKYTFHSRNGVLEGLVNPEEFEGLCEKVILCKPNTAMELMEVLMGAR